ncbi:MAG: hypothetical protein HN379_06395 [Desulfobacteraceae bacterium]|jgi:hypothetical protein|nr:hypothetical protein [Desulfobacteraceae bacterium]MBT4363886.1 hypothetical protein [Desulfobacteraceae bacterium]
MQQDYKIVSLVMVVITGILLQVLFCIVDSSDTPSRAAVEFSKAYFKYDNSMADRLCEESKTVNGENVVEKYIRLKENESKNRGYSPWFMKNKLYHIKTNTFENDKKNAKVRLTCIIKPPLKSFFTHESTEIDEVITLVKVGKVWKVCGKIFSLR